MLHINESDEGHHWDSPVARVGKGNKGVEFSAWS